MWSDGQQKTRPGRSAVRMRAAGGGQRGGSTGATSLVRSAPHIRSTKCPSSMLSPVITLALNQLTVAAALVYWPKPVGKHGGYDEYGASATAAMMQKYGSV